MATDLVSLLERLDIETGKVESTDDLLSLLTAAVDAYNAEAARPFEVAGTTLDRDATDVEQRALVLFGMWLHATWKAAAAAASAVVHSNVAGRTDLTGVAEAWRERRRETREALDRLMRRIAEQGALEEVQAEELGETRDLSAVSLTQTEVIRP